MFFTFNQNNSGGTFDESDGIGEYVIIEANDADHANARAEFIGLYFDGCDSGSDCPCCGDRWYRTWDGEGTESPLVWGREIEQGDNAYIHYLDGRVEYR